MDVAAWSYKKDVWIGLDLWVEWSIEHLIVLNNTSVLSTTRYTQKRNLINVKECFGG